MGSAGGGEDRREVAGAGGEAGANSFMLSAMEPKFTGSTPVLPAADTEESLRWWTQICGYTEAFRDATPANYAGISRGQSFLHISGMTRQGAGADGGGSDDGAHQRGGN